MQKQKLKKPKKKTSNVMLYGDDNNECTFIQYNFCDGAKCVRTCGESR